jgi:hypothetical protein
MSDYEITTRDRMRRLANEMEVIVKEWRGKSMPEDVYRDFIAKGETAEELLARYEAERGHW